MTMKVSWLLDLCPGDELVVNAPSSEAEMTVYAMASRYSRSLRKKKGVKRYSVAKEGDGKMRIKAVRE